jgi:hypothetical protein
MPQCQFPVFCYFCVSEKLHRKYSQNWTKRSPKFLFSPNTRRSPKKRRRGDIRGWPGGNAKTLGESAFFPEKFRSAAAVEDQFWGTKISILAPCQDEELPPEPSPLTPSTHLPSPSTLLSPMMRRE